MLNAPGREFAVVTAAGPVMPPPSFPYASGVAAGLMLWDQTPSAVVFRDEGESDWTNGNGEPLSVIRTRLASRTAAA